MIEADNLSKHFGSKVAVEDVSLRVEEGEIVGFLGPNGAGKTTVMRILTCFFPPTSGSARVAGYDVLENSLEVRRRIGYFPERVPIPQDMTIESFLYMAAEIKGVRKKNRNRTVGEVMERFNLNRVAAKSIKRLSKGYHQRVGLAQAFINDPPILILDEPTIGLDTEQVVITRQLIKGLAGEKTILLSTHILPEVAMTCQKVIIINAGSIVAIDSPENLTCRLQETSRVRVTIEAPIRAEVTEELRRMPHVLDVEENWTTTGGKLSFLVQFEKTAFHTPRDIAAMVHQKGWGLFEMTEVSMSLEEVVLKLVTEEGPGR
ncbi:MAG: ATP-binding cassette domain-containing protein [Thermodesulfobacteriota bacterium]|nr:ATP-binding cassette domain-containing protein [Thermodesulfobacteriota bacterium]